MENVTLNDIESIVGSGPDDCNPSTQTMFSAFKELAYAQTNPDSLVKITCRNSQESISACDYLARKAVANNWHREKGTVTHTKEGWPILELRNGSGVLIVIEKEEKPSG